jgi:hypothetical protein
MRLEQDQIAHPRLLRKPVLEEATDGTGIKVEVKAKKRKGSRFVGPTQLDEDQKSRIYEALEKKKIGDELGRQIFIGAVEYQISAFANRLERPVKAKPEKPQPRPRPRAPSRALEETLQAIVGNAASLSSLLRALPDGTKAQVTDRLASRDGLARTYGERYLSELSLEIDRLARACIVTAGEAEPPECEPPEREPEPKPDPTVSRELVAKLAGIFSECFEMEPTAEEGGAFRVALKVLGEVTGLTIEHEPAFLTRALVGPASNRQGS